MVYTYDPELDYAPESERIRSYADRFIDIMASLPGEQRKKDLRQVVREFVNYYYSEFHTLPPQFCDGLKSLMTAIDKETLWQSPLIVQTSLDFLVNYGFLTEVHLELRQAEDRSHNGQTENLNKD